MTQPPYVPQRDEDPSRASTTGWPPATNQPAGEQQADAELFASQFPEPSGSEPVYADPVYTEPASSDPLYSEPVSSTYPVDPIQGVRDRSTSDVAKEQAGAVRDTAVEKGQQVAGVAKDQAGAVKDTAVEKGQQVAGVAKDEASKVASEAGTQLKQLLGEGRSELSSQASTQQQRLASAVHSLATELGSMASGSNESGYLTELAHKGSRRGGEIAHWLENHEPVELLEEVKSFARRRPVTFLAAAAVAGIVVGRLTRGLAAEAKSDRDASIGYRPASTPQLGYQPARELGYESAPARENMSLQEIPTSGTGAGPTTDRPGHELDEGLDGGSRLYGTTGDVTR